MALIKCRECGSDISDKAAACVKCGAPVVVHDTAAMTPPEAAAAVEKPMPVWPWALAGVVILLWFAIASGNSPAARERMVAREAVSQCWQDQGRKSLDPTAARFAASVCEKMQSELSSGR